MIDFPQAKINLGLNIVGRRPDGYHDLETVFYPVPLADALEIHPMDDGFPSAADCDLKVTGFNPGGDEQQNLVVRAYNLLRACHPLPRIHAHLHKAIPSQAGMGGGSSDCAAMLKLLNRACSLGIDSQALAQLAATLGADCPFFVYGSAAYAEGIGDRLTPIHLSLAGWTLGIVCPGIPVSTREAFARVSPHPRAESCRQVVALPVEAWRGRLTNDFEQSVFALHPEIGHIKQRLYDLGAAYASMTGSGSSVYALFRQGANLAQAFPGAFTYVCKIE